MCIMEGLSVLLVPPPPSLISINLMMSYLCMVSYAMNSYHQFQELIKAGVGSEEVSSRICCADHVALYVVLLLMIERCVI